VLRLLRDFHNVLVSGPPATGKTRLLAEVAHAFAMSGPQIPALEVDAEIPLPEGRSVAGGRARPSAPPQHPTPAAGRNNRGAYRTAFHPGTKYRDFLRGITPQPGAAVGTFMVSSGTLYRASLRASEPGGAALVIIDEINRGPAVQIFGDAIVAFEADKRLAPDNTPTATTAFFELLDGYGEMQRFALPHHLYLLGAMNQADTSVEPLDVAFLRRWEPFHLDPNPEVLREHFALPAPMPEPSERAATAIDVYTTVHRAWRAVNRRIALARGREFQIGHGVFMHDHPPLGTVPEAIAFARTGWARVRAHIDEAFFGDVRGIAAVLNTNTPGHPFSLREAFFAESPVAELVEPDPLSDEQFYALLRAVGQEA
jgi:5-methylcytosine-specific restriction protein B